MSDNEDGGKKSGYRLEYATSARAKCKGPKPCSGTVIPKGALRFGSVVDFQGKTSFAWRHWGCVTPKVLENVKRQFDEPDDLDGFDDLEDEDKDRIRKAWEEGRIPDEDIPESARKAADDEEDDDEEKPKKKKAAAKEKKAKDDGPTKFKLEYASSGRAKCKGGCGETIGKDYFRLGHEVDFRGNKSFTFQHWGCAPDAMIEKLKASYSSAEEIEGFGELKENEQEKVKRAWEEGVVPDDDKGPGEPVATEKKKRAPAKRAKKDDDDEDDEKPVKKRARKAKKDDDEEEEEEKPKKRAKKARDPYDDDEDEDEEEKPKPKRAPAKEKAAPKKRAPKKKLESDDSGEDFRAAIDAVSGDDDEMEEEEPQPKRKPASKPASKKSSAPPSKSKPAAKPASRKKRQEPIEEEDDD